MHQKTAPVDQTRQNVANIPTCKLLHYFEVSCITKMYFYVIAYTLIILIGRLKLRDQIKECYSPFVEIVKNQQGGTNRVISFQLMKVSDNNYYIHGQIHINQI